MTCDYNGWNDAPEEEREWFDQHPEIWGGPTREADDRPVIATDPPTQRPALELAAPAVSAAAPPHQPCRPSVTLAAPSARAA